MTAPDPGKPTEADETDQPFMEPAEASLRDTSGSHPPEDLSRNERRALALIRDRGGIYQSELWKELDVSSRTGTRIARGLASRGLVERTETTYRDRKTYLLRPAQPDVHATEGAASGTRASPTESDTGGGATHAAADEVSLTGTERRALNLVSERGPVPLRELCQLLDLAPETGEQVVRSLVDSNRLQREETTLYGRRASLLTAADTGSPS